MRILKSEGLEMPAERAFNQEFKPGRGDRCDFKDLVRLVWPPLVAGIDRAASGDDTKLSESLEKNIKAIEIELSLPESLEDFTVDDWVKAVQQHIQRFVGCLVTTEHIARITGSLVPFKMEASSASAFIVLRSSLLKDLVGTSMAKRVGECALAEVSGLRLPQAPPDLDRCVREDLVRLLEQRGVESENLEGHNEGEQQPGSLKRLRGIATKRRCDGGLELCRDGSKACHEGSSRTSQVRLRGCVHRCMIPRRCMAPSQALTSTWPSGSSRMGCRLPLRM